MKKHIALFLVLCLIFPCFTGCSKYEGTVKQETSYANGDACTVFQFEDFCGTFTTNIKREQKTEGTFYYWALLYSGSMSVSVDQGILWGEEPLFTTVAGIANEGSTGYIERSGAYAITFTSEVPVSGEIIISFVPLHTDCPFRWSSSESGHSKIMLCDCCEAPAVEEPHEDRNGDMFCDICEHNIILIDPPTNHFLRNQAGCEWLNEITAEDIAEIKIISEAVGVAPGTSLRSSYENLYPKAYGCRHHFHRQWHRNS